MKGDQVPLGDDDAGQEALASQVKRGKGRLPKPSKPDLRRHHPLSAGRNSAEIHFRFPDGRQLDMKNLSEDLAREVHRNCLRASGVSTESLPEPRQAKPGEVAHTLTLSGLQQALLKVGPAGAYVHELVEMATDGVITREHEMFKTFRTRFNNAIRRCTPALEEQGLQVWSFWERVDGVNLKRYGCSPTLPQGAELVE